MEFLLVALIFIISYIVLAAIGHYFVYTSSDDESSGSALDAESIKSLRIIENALKNAWEIGFVMNDQFVVSPLFGAVTDADAQQFRTDFVSNSVAHLTILDEIFNSDIRQESLNAVRRMPTRIYFLGRRWSVKNTYDVVNRLLYIFLVDEAPFSLLLEERSDLVGIYESDRTSVLDRIDEYIIKSRSEALKKSSDVDELRMEFVRRLRLLVLHIADMDLKATSNAYVEFTSAILEQKEKTIPSFLEVYNEERCLLLTRADRERLRNSIENGGDANIFKMELMADLDRFFAGADSQTPYDEVLLAAKKTLFTEVTNGFVNNLNSDGLERNRKLNRIELDWAVNNSEMNAVLKFMPNVMPVVEALIMHPLQAPNERFRRGKSEFISVWISAVQFYESVKIRVRTDCDCISEQQISEMTDGRYVRSNDIIVGTAVHDESKTIQNFDKCLNILKQIGGRADFEIGAGDYTEFIFTVPVIK